MRLSVNCALLVLPAFIWDFHEATPILTESLLTNGKFDEALWFTVERNIVDGTSSGKFKLLLFEIAIFRKKWTRFVQKKGVCFVMKNMHLLKS